MTLEIRLLGGFLLKLHGASPGPLASRTARSLFAYLVTQSAYPHTRERLMGTFWPDAPEATARRRLSQALWEINSALRTDHDEHPYIRAEAETIQFNPHSDFWLDVAEFEQKLNEGGQAGLTEAIALYQGDLLAGYYDDWLLVERERLREQFLAALDELITIRKSGGRYNDALALALRLVHADPLREEAWREVMLLCVLLGRPQEALQRYAQCRDVLAEELAVDPSLTTMELARRIEAIVQGERTLTPPQPTNEPAAEPPLVGRQQERAALVRAVEQMLGGEGGVVLVEGEPGIGKTRLLQQMRDDALWRNVQVLSGQGQEHTAAPYAALRQALAACLTPLRVEQLAHLVEPVWLQQASRLLPALRRGASHPPPQSGARVTDQQRQLWEALARLLLALTSFSPFLLVLDDLQWADEGTLEAMRHLVSRLHNEPLLLVLSYRPEEARQNPLVWETLRSLDQAGVHTRLPLKPLDPEATARLVREELGARQDAQPLAHRLHKETGGNPLFVLETLRYLREGSVLAQTEDGRADELPLSPVLRQLIDTRLARLHPDSRALAEAASVVGYQVDFGPLVQTADLSPTSAVGAAHTLTRRGLLREEEHGYVWRHDLLRQTTYMSIPRHRLPALHRRAGDALEASQTVEVAALARHFTLGEVWSKAVRYHVQAGEQAAQVYAHRTALAAYVQALALLEKHRPLPEDEAQAVRYKIFAERQELYWMQGRIAEQDADAASLVEVARAMQDPRRLADALLIRALALFALYRSDESIAVCEEAVALAQHHAFHDLAAIARTYQGDAYLRVDALDKVEQVLHEALRYWDMYNRPHVKTPGTYGRLALLYKRTSRFERAEAALQAGLSVAEANQDRFWQAILLSERVSVAVSRADYAAGIRLAQQALSRFRELGMTVNEPVVYGNLAVAYLGLGQYAQAADCIQRSLDGYRANANHRGAAYALLDFAELYHATGRLDEAQAVVVEAQTLADELQATYIQAMAQIMLARIHLRQGKPAAARTRLDEAEPLAESLQTRLLMGQCALLRSLDQIGRGNWAAAAAGLDGAATIFDEGDLAAWRAVACSYRAVALWHLGQEDVAQEVSAQAYAWVQTHAGGEEVPAIYRNHWQILTATGQADAACALLEVAMTLLHERAASLSDAAWQQAFWENVPEHRALMVAWQAQQPQCMSVRLPHQDAPLGRPLDEDEWVAVQWTVRAPDDEKLRSKKQRRQHRLLRLLDEAAAQQAAPRVEDLAAALDVTPKTIKRDLAELRSAGRPVITRGSRT